MIVMSQENSKLKEYASKLERSLPSEVENEFLLELERFVNDLYISQHEQDCPADMNVALLDAVGLIGSLSYKARNMSDCTRDADFFTGLKKLAQLLEIIEFYLEETNS